MVVRTRLELCSVVFRNKINTPDYHQFQRFIRDDVGVDDLCLRPHSPRTVLCRAEKRVADAYPHQDNEH